MAWVQLVFDFLAKVAWPAIGVAVLVALWKPVRPLLASLDERVRTDLVSTTFPGGSATFERRSIDTNIIAAANESEALQRNEGEPLDERAVADAIVGAYVSALAKAFEQWHLDQAFEEGEKEGEPTEALIEWIRGPGNALVTQYSIFERLVEHLRQQGWAIPAIPSAEKFEKASRLDVHYRALTGIIRRAERQQARERQTTALVNALRRPSSRGDQG